MRPIIIFAVALAAIGGSAAAQPFEQTGSASWYGSGHHGKKTASGEPFDMHKMTAAHPKLPLGSVVEVTNLTNDKSVRVRVNDRGPFKASRILDVSRAAAEELGFIGAGTARVHVRLVDKNADDLRPKLSPDVAPEPAPAIVLTQTAQAAGRYTVQIGTFSVRENAERAAARVASIGSATLAEDWGTGRVLHRVVLTGSGDRSAAETAKSAVIEAGFADARITAIEG